MGPTNAEAEIAKELESASLLQNDCNTQNENWLKEERTVIN